MVDPTYSPAVKTLERKLALVAVWIFCGGMAVGALIGFLGAQ